PQLSDLLRVPWRQRFDGAPRLGTARANLREMLHVSVQQIGAQAQADMQDGALQELGTGTAWLRLVQETLLSRTTVAVEIEDDPEQTRQDHSQQDESHRQALT